MALIDDVKLNLRISGTAYNAEISDLILSAKADLGISGLLDEFISDSDALIKRAIILYCKANFGLDNPNAEKYQKSYDMLKSHLSLSSDYAFYPVLFTITDAGDDSEIRLAEVTFNGEVKYTDENGEVTFYAREGSNYQYAITAEGYESDEPEDVTDNLVDVSASATIEIALNGA